MEFKLARGIHVTNLDGIHEAYEAHNSNKGFTQIRVNVSAEHLDHLVRELVKLVREPAFLVLECGTQKTEEDKLRKSSTDPFHKDVYYLDGLTQKTFLTIFESYEDLFLNDGGSTFGFGSHSGYDEVEVGAYKIVRVYADDPKKYLRALNAMGLRREATMRTVWDNISKENPGHRDVITSNGKRIYDVVNELKPKGLYFKERRED